VRFTVDRLDHLVLTCRDAEVSAAWYQRVLGMEREEFGARNRTALRFGGQKINVRQADDAGEWATAPGAAPGSMDLCFTTAIAPDDIVAHLRGCGVEIVDGPAAKIGALGPLVSVYCRDPDGNKIEIASYMVETL
jgi:catechol 2,3-dioxygenase-like lactoylglutathione lyase family enzyme